MYNIGQTKQKPYEPTNHDKIESYPLVEDAF